MIKVELTKKDAELFKVFREYQDRFELLLAHNIFEIKNGHAEIHFDYSGNIHNIKAHLNIYRQNDNVVPTIFLTKLL